MSLWIHSNKVVNWYLLGQRERWYLANVLEKDVIMWKIELVTTRILTAQKYNG